MSVTVQARYTNPINQQERVLSVEVPDGASYEVFNAAQQRCCPHLIADIRSTADGPCDLTIPLHLAAETDRYGHITHCFEERVQFARPAKATISVHNTLWWPLVWVHHTAIPTTGWWARLCEVNGTLQWAYRTPTSNDPLPLSEALQNADNIPVWTQAAAEGMLIHVVSEASNTGYHYLAWLHRLDMLYRIKTVLRAHPLWRDGAAAVWQQMEGPHITWYVSDGIFSGWLLESVRNIPTSVVAQINMYGANPEPSARQGDLLLYALDIENEPQLWPECATRTIYDHYVPAQWWLRWYDTEQHAAKAIAYIPEACEIIDSTHARVQVAAGWYLLVHPRHQES